MAGIKYDEGKVQPSLVLNTMARAVLEVSKVATFGAAKYSKDNWLLVEDAIERYTDAKQRHMLNSNFEELDKESHISHLAHEAWNALAILELTLRQKEQEHNMDKAVKETDTYEDYRIYGKESCTWCDRAKELLSNLKIPYNYVDINQDEEARAFVIESGAKTVPQIYYKGSLLGGYEKLKEHLDETIIRSS